MNKKFQASLQLDLRCFGGKVFKVIADIIRSGLKNEHGYKATKGFKDSRLKRWSIVIRFATVKNRMRFENTLKNLLHPQILKQMDIKYLIPKESVIEPIRWVA